MNQDRYPLWTAFLAENAPPTAMSAVEAEGCLAAFITVPNEIPFLELLPDMWGGDDPQADSAGSAAALMNAAMAMITRLGRDIADEGDAWRPLYLAADDDVDMPACETWMRGYWKAVLHDPDGWYGVATDADTQHLAVPFAPFMPWADQDDELTPDELAELKFACARAVPSVLAGFCEIPRPLSTDAPQQPRRVVKIGRNEPCPCGSGKKYKKCCGAG